MEQIQKANGPDGINAGRVKKKCACRFWPETNVEELNFDCCMIYDMDDIWPIFHGHIEHVSDNIVPAIDDHRNITTGMFGMFSGRIVQYQWGAPTKCI